MQNAEPPTWCPAHLPIATEGGCRPLRQCMFGSLWSRDHFICRGWTGSMSLCDFSIFLWGCNSTWSPNVTCRLPSSDLNSLILRKTNQNPSGARWLKDKVEIRTTLISPASSWKSKLVSFRLEAKRSKTCSPPTALEKAVFAASWLVEGSMPPHC